MSSSSIHRTLLTDGLAHAVVRGGKLPDLTKLVLGGSWKSWPLVGKSDPSGESFTLNPEDVD